MENQNEPTRAPQRDFTLPLFLTGILTAILCTVLCAVLYFSRDFISNDLAPNLGLVDPTPLPLACPSLDTTWGTKVGEAFTSNYREWPLGKDSNEYGDSNIRFDNGQLLLDIIPAQDQGVFLHPTPKLNDSLSDFYFTVLAQQTQGSPQDGYGLIFRADASVVHYFYITKHGDIILQQFDSEKKWGAPLHSQFSIPVKDTDMNKLTVIHSEDQAIFCVNNMIAFTQNDIGYVFGNFGVAVSVGRQGQGSSFVFDDFKLFAPLP